MASFVSPSVSGLLPSSAFPLICVLLMVPLSSRVLLLAPVMVTLLGGSCMSTPQMEVSPLLWIFLLTHFQMSLSNPTLVVPGVGRQLAHGTVVIRDPPNHQTLTEKFGLGSPTQKNKTVSRSIWKSCAQVRTLLLLHPPGMSKGPENLAIPLHVSPMVLRLSGEGPGSNKVRTGSASVRTPTWLPPYRPSPSLLHS